MIKSLEQKIMNHVLTGFEVNRIIKEDDHWVISDGKKKRYYDKIVSTIPVQALVKAVSTPTKVKDSARNLKHNSLISVMIGLNKRKINNLSWLYIPDREVLPHRVSFPSNFSPNTVPAGKSSAMAEITCNIGTEIWLMKDEEIIERVLTDLHQMRILNKKDICFSDIKRSEYAYVINDLEYNANLKTLSDYFTGIGIDLVGRFAEFKYLNMDDCIKSAMNYLCIG